MSMPRAPTSPSRWVALIAAAYFIAILLVKNQYYQLMMTLVPVWATMGLSWNILSGYSGLVSFGHASFFGLGAYTVALLLITFGLTPWIGIPIAAGVGALAGLVIGYPTFRLRGHYFALAMLAYPLALLYVFEWLGYQEVSLPMHRENPVAYMQFSDNRVYSALALAMMVLALLASLRIERSRFGMSLLAIKQNEIAAEAAGIDTFRWKLKAIVLSGLVAGAIGGFYAVVLLVVTPASVFGMLTSAQALIVALFGGVGSAWGPVIGSAILIPLAEVLQAELGDRLPGIQGVVYGIAIILVILFAPEGIFWRTRDLWLARRSAGSSPASEARLATEAETFGSAGSIRQGVEREAGQTMLEVSGLSKSFGGLKAVQDVSFAVRAGEILGIIGPNGAGKTTLFNILNGILQPDTGKVHFMGHSLQGLATNRIARLGIGRTFQVARPFARLSVLDNVAAGAYVATQSDEDAYALARAALDKVGLTGAAHLTAGGITTQQIRLLELARALAGQPKLLLLDETLAGLGSQEVEGMLELIRRLAADGLTIVIIEHTMHAMVRLADRFIVLDHGAVLAQGTPDAVTHEPSVIEAYLGKKWSARANA
jgi:ABC-type branched-subunit amino acid transport system ATPase component/ABC-type branched-subunit amino acid transport system permease subunit